MFGKYLFILYYDERINFSLYFCFRKKKKRFGFIWVYLYYFACFSGLFIYSCSLCIIICYTDFIRVVECPSRINELSQWQLMIISFFFLTYMYSITVCSPKIITSYLSMILQLSYIEYYFDGFFFSFHFFHFS